MSSVEVVYLIITILCGRYFADGSIDSFQFDVNDILNEKFMPAHLLAQEIESFLKGPSNITRDQFYEKDTTNCNFTTAFSTMGFHRKMMNEFLATNFLAKQILNEFPLDNVQPIEKRFGAPSPNATIDAIKVEGNHRRAKYISNELLEEPGSTSYRSWLDKTATLDDLQRQFSENSQSVVNDFKPIQQEADVRRKSVDNDDDTVEEEDFDDGDITGYAYSGGAIDPIPSYPQAMPPSRHHLSFDATNQILNSQPLYPTAGSKNGYYPPSSHDNPYNENYGPPIHHVQSQAHQQIKEIGLKDIMDIALTTLAFLSFGMFILQVLMCITMNKEDTSNMMMMPMEAGNGEAILQANTDGTTDEIRRKKRSSQENRQIQMMNELSRRILHSIDAALVIPRDNGRCHYHSLCENNKFARLQKNGQKVWIPVWSLGMSWFSSRMDSSNTTTGNAVMESLKAAVIGLGNGDCTKIYSSCQMEVIADERSKLKKRIEKRDVSNHFEWSA